jgi:alpha-mannosidase
VVCNYFKINALLIHSVPVLVCRLLLESFVACRFQNKEAVVLRRTDSKLWFSVGALLVMAGVAIAYDLTRDKCNFEVAVGHLDTQFGWPRDSTYNNYIPETLHRNFELFRSNPRYIFSFGGAFRYWIVEQYGQNTTIGGFRKGDWDTLKAYIARGRWALAGSMIDEIDVNMPCAEAMCRNFLYGNGYFEDKFGTRSFDILLPDCFGFSYSLPTFANHFGVRGFSTQKFDRWGGWWAPVENARSIMRWQGPDGSIIYGALKPTNYASGYEVDTAAGNAIKALCGMWIGYDYYGVGDKGGAPDSGTVSELCNLTDGKINNVYVFPAASDSLFRMLDRLEKEGNACVGRLSLYDGEMIMKSHGTGSYTSRADIKALYRGMELAGLRAEPAAVAAKKLAGVVYPQQKIWRAWFKGIDHAFHDDLTGTSTPEAYNNSWDCTINDLDSQITSFDQICGNSNSAVAAVLNTQVSFAGGVPVVVYNPLGLDRRDVVQATVTLGAATQFVKVIDPSGMEAPSQIIQGKGTDALTILFIAQVPSAGYAVYEVQPAVAESQLQTGLTVAKDGSSMSNDNYEVSIDANGDISQIADKSEGGRDLFANPHRWELRSDNSSAYPAWEVLEADVRSSPTGYIDENVKRTVTENGPVRVSVRVTRNKSNSTYVHYYRLCADSAGRIVVADNAVDWNSSGSMLKAAFYFACSNSYATYSVGVGTIDRPTSGTDERYEVPAQQWATIGNGEFGVAVINHYKYGWSMLSNNNLSNTLIHSPRPNIGSNYGGDTAMTHTFAYAIYGYGGDWKNGVEAQSQRFNMPLCAFQTLPHGPAAQCGRTFSFVRASDPSKVMIMAIKKAEKSDDYVVRVREIAAASSNVKLIFSYTILAARETNGMEDDAGAAFITPAGMNHNEIGFAISKYQLKTFRVTLGDENIATSVARSGSIPSPDDIFFTVAAWAGCKRSVAKFFVLADEKVRKVYVTDIAGRMIRVLHDGPRPLSASTRLVWNGGDVSRGVYVVTIVTDRMQRHALLHFVK